MQRSVIDPKQAKRGFWRECGSLPSPLAEAWKSGKLFAAAFPLLFAAFTSPAPAASFDCGKAGTAVEKAICADVEAIKP